MKQPLFTTDKDIILASASPRRQAFLQELGLQFTTQPASIDETPQANESAENFVRRMAATKAEYISALRPKVMVIGADTVISFQGETLGKPISPADALDTLQKLQGKSHEVITALSLCCAQDNLSTTVSRATTVTFGHFSREILETYIRSGEPMDKAGSYAIQGQGGFLVKKICGSCSNVIGLPMNDLVTLLLTHNVISPYRPE